ncbi:MAG: MBL fold metallo-hydrolase [Rickettsiales bacterium]|nr:MBL fold metallo-hydrolase [Rickettsiales bacterium]
MRVTILGCGSSAGVPKIGCQCEVCQSDNPKNYRTRVSLWVETGGKSLLIDSSPDLREQALRENITQLDAVLYTHEHADHIMGIDDLRSFNWLAKKAIDIYGDQRTIEALKSRFPYIFRGDNTEYRWYAPTLNPHILEASTSQFSAAGIDISYFNQGHGRITSLGFRIGNMAYSTDTDYLSDETLAQLQGLDLWIVDCLRYDPSPSHANLEMTLGWIEKTKPKLAVLTHMAHDMGYEELLTRLPEGVIPAYDGWSMQLAGG